MTETKNKDLESGSCVRMSDSDKDRFFTLVRVCENTGCWIWTGSTSNGYGYFSLRGKGRRAHRILYFNLVGSLETTEHLDHKCLVKKCVNPAHLEVVSSRENTIRHFNLDTHCRNGHEWNEYTRRIDVKGHRNCRACNKIKCRAAYQIRKASKPQ